MTSAEQHMPRLEELLERWMRRLGRERRAVLGPEISPPQFMLMRYLARAGRASVSEVSTRNGVSPSAVTSLSDRLVRAGFLRRGRDERDRRVVWLALTPKGEQVFKEFRARQRELVMHYLRELPEEDILALVRIFERLNAIIEGKRFPATPSTTREP